MSHCNHCGLSREFLEEPLRPYQPCTRSDSCKQCGMAHTGECGDVWEYRGKTTKIKIWDGEAGEYKLYLHRTYNDGKLVWCSITIAKEGSTVGGSSRLIVREIAKYAAQGADALRTHLKHLRGQRFQPFGRTSLAAFPECTSIPDLVAQILLKEMDDDA